jgi:hypothetical protein
LLINNNYIENINGFQIKDNFKSILKGFDKGKQRYYIRKKFYTYEPIPYTLLHFSFKEKSHEQIEQPSKLLMDINRYINTLIDSAKIGL